MVNLSEVWLRVNVDKRSVHPHEIVAKFREGSCLIKVEIFSLYDVLIIVFTGLISSASSKGICCAPSSNRDADCLALAFSTSGLAPLVEHDD